MNKPRLALQRLSWKTILKILAVSVLIVILGIRIAYGQLVVNIQDICIRQVNNALLGMTGENNPGNTMIFDKDNKFSCSKIGNVGYTKSYALWLTYVENDSTYNFAYDVNNNELKNNPTAHNILENSSNTLIYKYDDGSGYMILALRDGVKINGSFSTATFIGKDSTEIKLQLLSLVNNLPYTAFK